MKIKLLKEFRSRSVEDYFKKDRALSEQTYVHLKMKSMVIQTKSKILDRQAKLLAFGSSFIGGFFIACMTFVISMAV